MPGVADVLHHFGGAERGLKNFPRCPGVEFTKQCGMVIIAGSDDGHGRLHEVGYGSTFAHEFRVDTDAEIFPKLLPADALERRNHNGFGGSGQYRTAEHDQVKGIFLFQRFADAAANRLNVSEVELAAAQAGSADAEKRNVGFKHCGGRIRGGPEPGCFVAFSHKFGHSWLDDRTASAFELLNLGAAEVDAGDRIPPRCQTCRCDRSDIAESKYAYLTFHRPSLVYQ